jgi:hypothetical protein
MAERKTKRLKEPKPGYATIKSMQDFFAKIRTLSPSLIDKAFLQANLIAPKNELDVLKTLYFLGVIEADGTVAKEKLQLLQMKGEAFQGNLSAIVNEAYTDVFSTVDLSTAQSDEGLFNYFKKTHTSVQFAKRAVSLFLWLCLEAGIKLSEELERRAQQSLKLSEAIAEAKRGKPVPREERKAKKVSSKERLPKKERKKAMRKDTIAEVRLPRIGVKGLKPFLHYAMASERTPLDVIATAMGYEEKERASSASQLANYIWTADVFGLAVREGDEILLKAKGRKFLKSDDSAKQIIREAFSSDFVLGPFSRMLCVKGKVISAEEFNRVVTIYSKDPAAGNRVQEWMLFAGLISEKEDGNIDLHFELTDTGVHRPHNRVSLQERIYRNLVFIGFLKSDSSNPQNYKAIEQLLNDFRTSLPDKSERKMCELVARILSCFGFVCQFENGPREERDAGKAKRLEFGPQGDDLAAFTYAAEELDGIALAAELKRSRANKNSVKQAVLFRDRIETLYNKSVAAIPVVISDSSGYCDRVAKEYASTSRVVHLPLSGLWALLEKQKDRFESGDTLIDSFHILRCINSLIQSEYYEPTDQDLSNLVQSMLS